jgi:uncharacterized membrane protein
MDRSHPFPQFPRGGFRGGLIERVGDHGGGWPDALAWAIFAVLLTLLLLAIVSLAFDAYYRSQRPRRFVRRFPAGPPGIALGGGALAVLDMRYARGDIDRDAYLRARSDIGASEAPTAEMPARAEPPAEGGDEPTR